MTESWRTTIRTYGPTAGGVLVMTAVAAATGVIWLMLTAPESVPGVVDGQAGALRIVAQALWAVLAQIIRYL